MWCNSNISWLIRCARREFIVINCCTLEYIIVFKSNISSLKIMNEKWTSNEERVFKPKTKTKSKITKQRTKQRQKTNKQSKQKTK